MPDLPPGKKVLVILSPDMANQAKAFERQCAEWMRLAPGTYEVRVATKEKE